MQCDTCAYYSYDDDAEEYYCECEMDEDDMYHFLTSTRPDCPFYRVDDEYAVVRHQM